MCLGDDICGNFERGIIRSMLTNLVADENGFKVYVQPKRASDSGGIVTGESGAEGVISIQEGFLFIMEILEACGRRVPQSVLDVSVGWRKEIDWETKTFRDLFEFIRRKRYIDIYCFQHDGSKHEHMMWKKGPETGYCWRGSRHGN